MRRRRFLRLGAGVVSGVGLAGCGSGATSQATSATAGTTTGESTPTNSNGGESDGVYVQTFTETMSMQGRATAGDYGFGLAFTVPHTFWTVTGRDVSRVDPTDDDAVHLMASVWDRETRTVLPESGLSVEITRDGSLVSEEVIYPMLSQTMGFHWGGNFALDGDGAYTVTVSVGGTSLRRTGTFEGRFGSPASVEIPLAFTTASRREVSSQPLDRGGQQGALQPHGDGFPRAVLPATGSLPGTVRGRGLTDDARLVVATFPDAGRVGAPDRQYLAVSARTRYNRFVLPAMALTATLERDGETVEDGTLERTLSPDLGYHYGTAVDDVQSGDELTLSTMTPPQVARHEGYETAFRQMDDVTATL